MNYTCADCRRRACRKPDHEGMPANCPMQTDPELIASVNKKYLEPETLRFFQVSAKVEKDGWGRWPRVKETIIFCQRMHYHHLGVAFCAALEQEAAQVCQLLRDAGFTVDAVRCKCGGTNKTEFGIPKEDFVHEGDFEPACDPIGQAALLNKAGTEFNIVIGLCVGHDSLFLENAKARSTVMIVKDRVLGHNPVQAVYLNYHGYWGDMKETPEETAAAEEELSHGTVSENLR